MSPCVTNSFGRNDSVQLALLFLILFLELSAPSLHSPSLLWMVPHGHPKDLHFPKTIYARISFLLQWIITPAYCSFLPKICCYNHKTVLHSVQGFYLQYSTEQNEHSFNTDITAWHYSSTPVVIMEWKMDSLNSLPLSVSSSCDLKTFSDRNPLKSWLFNQLWCYSAITMNCLVITLKLMGSVYCVEGNALTAPRNRRC